jgi:iron complex transport system ATP-binding protein
VHDVSLAAHHADRVLILCNGRLSAQGRPADVLTADNVGKAFAVRAQVLRHPLTGRPLVATAARRSQEAG